MFQTGICNPRRNHHYEKGNAGKPQENVEFYIDSQRLVFGASSFEGYGLSISVAGISPWIKSKVFTKGTQWRVPYLDFTRKVLGGGGSDS